MVVRLVCAALTHLVRRRLQPEHVQRNAELLPADLPVAVAIPLAE